MEEIRAKNERIRVKEMGGFCVDELSVLASINRDKKLCRYDEQNSTLYMNHSH